MRPPAPSSRLALPLALASLLTVASTLPACGDDDPADSSGPDADVAADAGADSSTDTDSDTDTGAPDTDSDGPDADSDALDADPDASAPRPDIPAGVTPAELVLPAHEPPPEVELPEGVRLRVATFNLHGGGDATAEAIGAYLATLDADIVGLQECPAELLDALAMHGGFAHAAGGGNALLSRHPLDNVEALSLEAGRGFIRARLAVDGVTFAFYNAHLGWDAAGDLQIRELIDEHLALEPLPHLIVVGDFNDEHGSTQIALLDEVLDGAFEALGWYPGQRISWPSVEFDRGEGSQHIDLVFTGRAAAPIVVDGDVVNVSPVLSDHKPVWADLLFPRSPDAPFAGDPLAPYRDPWRHFPAEADRPPNLLTNPGAEDGLDGWEVSGEAESATTREEHGPRSGARFFTGFADRRDVTSPHSSGAQTVSLAEHAELVDAGRGELLVSGWLTTGYRVDVAGDVRSNVAQPYDDGELMLDLLDGDGALLLRRTSGRRDTLGYRPWVDRVALPPGTRGARLTWLAHHKPQNGPSNDAIFDDLYLGLVAADAPDDPVEPAPIQPLLGRNLLRDPGAEDGDLAGWETTQWQSLPDLQPIGLTLYPPWSHSGRRFLYAGPRLYVDDTPEGEQRLAQTIDLAGLSELVDADALALRWGGVVRTWAARAEVRLRLEILDRDGEVWGAVEADAPVTAAEWTRVESLTRLPRGTHAVRLVVTATLGPEHSGAFADELFVVPERLAGDASP